MYKCECGYVFEEPAINIEKHGLDNPAYEELESCPSCKETCFEKARRCKICDKYFMTDNSYSEIVCSDCLEEAEQNYNTKLGKKFMEDRSKYLEEAERDFYLRYLFEIKGCNDMDRLINVLRGKLYSEFAEDLKDYCMEDKVDFALFYYSDNCKFEFKGAV